MLVEIFTDNFASLVVGLTACFLVWIVTNRPSDIPPGPWFTLPIVGNLFQMRGDKRAIFNRMRKKYGDIFSLYLGNRLVIVMNGFEVLREAFIKNGDVFSYRPDLYLFDQISGGKGLIASSGSIWKEQRTFAMSTLRDLGVGRNILEMKVQEEAVSCVSALRQKQGEAFDMSDLVHAATSNIICSLVFGKRFLYDDEKFLTYLRTASENMQRTERLGILNFFPFLRYLPSYRSRLNELLDSSQNIQNGLIKESIVQHMLNYDEEHINDFISAYIREMKENENRAEKTSIDEVHLVKTIGNMFVAGTDTTATTILWTILHWINFPKEQEKCFKEIRENIGILNTPCINDKPKLPYLEATILEVLRLANVVPLSLPHGVPHDINFRGYRIPQSAILIPNIESVLKDPQIWEDPNVFWPGRFLDKDGNVTKQQELIPFFLGRRLCLGKSLAEMELFIFLASMLQQFRFTAEGDTAPPLKGVLGVVFQPKYFKLRAIIRQ